MRIKTLEMSGFKSFVDRTVINFEDGITGVVGPNGCGKSNIVDSIRWVMGEMSAKHLRGSAMEDVIFNGCESRPPVGMAQVFLTFDNSDGRAPAEYSQYSEIQVGRRLYRSGESEYFINKTPCRLKDIVDLFLGTGVGTKAYSIVEQGMVGNIVSSKPEDRRILVEEAAGISKFKSRKEAALRKMESTRQNLARLTDVLGELERQMNSLNRQAKKAERFKKISDELRDRELVFFASKYRSARTELESIQNEHVALHQDEVSALAELSGFESGMEEMRLAISELERELDGASQQLYGVKNSIKLYEAEIVHKQNETASIQQQNRAYADELESLRSRLLELSSRIEDANAAMVDADIKLAGSSNFVETAEKGADEIRSKFSDMKRQCDAAGTSVMELAKEIANLTASMDHLERRRIEVNGRIAKNQAELDGIDSRRQQIESDLHKKDAELLGLRQMKFAIAGESESAATTLEQQKREFDEAEKRVRELRDLVSDRRSRLDSIVELRKNLEGYRDGVRAVLSRTDSEGKKLEGFVGTVGEIFETESDYEPALGAVLGEKLQYVVVKSHEEGVDAIDYLRTATSGRSSFIPVGVRASEEATSEPEGEGVIGPIKNFVRFSDEYKQICNHLLGDVVLVNDLKLALSLWESGSYKKTFVTVDGCVVDPYGVVTGGSGGGVEEQLVAQKRRERELSEELAKYKGELTRAEGEAQKFKDHVSSMELRVDQLGRDVHNEELKLIGYERDIERIKDEISRYDRERDKLSVETAALVEELAETDAEREQNARRLAECNEQHTTHEERLSIMRSELESLSSLLTGREKELMDLKVQFAQAGERASLVARELDGLVRDKSSVVASIGRRLGEINSANQRSVVLSREIDDLRCDLDLAISASTNLEKVQRELREKYEAESTSMRNRELDIREIRKRHDEVLAKYHDADIKLTEYRAKVQFMIDGIRERYHLDLPSIEGQYAKDDLDLDAEEAIVADLKDKIEKIGSVNVDAIGEYNELTERFTFMSKQHQDLASSLDNLSRAIAKINRTSRQRFRRAFDAVDAQFQELFPKLFKGGKARLLLTDEENILESGIEIVAQPPGKKLQSITLLSGGEKALTAVALIFSIFLIKPSPFCLLDEVDAPLDDVNIDRFNDLIRSMVPYSQFILITHNKRTMELADILYGVTMEEAGVSKMVSVKLAADKAQEPQVA
ncbi:MAG: Chromosome partition protein Smc [bacterium ADurb.Bin270]|nr:chromosome segregation protein SMC [Myxococcales bacterium]OQA61345.1 MAG: Chromosome partition protein Smc [bacterium ADurb.Bin270]HQG13113.1 chromosome segregation protein SMC [bacterium]